MIAASRKLAPTALLLLLICAAWTGPGSRLAAQAPHTGTLTVHVSAIRNAEGNLLVTLRRDENTVVERRTVEIDSKTLSVQVVFSNLPEGTYGVVVVHDENKNGKLDFNEMGMPVEGYGYSNNPAKRPGPSPFDETKFSLASPGTTTDIALIYWP